MEIEIIKIEETTDSTLSQMRIDGRFFCFVLEDGYREQKQPGKTRIPHGTYSVERRTWGGFYEDYKRRFGHEFSIELSNVPNFKYILIHTGNTVADTDGCLLVGAVAAHDGKNFLLRESTVVYKQLYAKVDAAFRRNETVQCHVLRFVIQPQTSTEK